MKRVIYIGIILVAIFSGCEDVYVADLDVATQHLVVEARIDASKTSNSIRIYKTVGFYDDNNFPAVTQATVNLIDNNGNTYSFLNSGTGYYYLNNFQVNANRKYKLEIAYDGETYESSYEPVPEKPNLDTVYAEAMLKTVIDYDYEGNKTLEKQDGVQFYADIDSLDMAHYYRFYARKIRLSNYPFDTIMFGLPVTVTKYIWHSFYSSGSYNIAAPAPYSSDYNIYKHPLEFINTGFTKLLDYETNERERAWIYIIHQYSIPVSAYQFYKELNKQLESEGKIFDPMYSQAFGNIKCTSDSKKVILGNFEIQNYREHRYSLKVLNRDNDIRVEKIETFYDISIAGKKSITAPDFWIF